MFLVYFWLKHGSRQTVEAAATLHMAREAFHLILDNFWQRKTRNMVYVNNQQPTTNNRQLRRTEQVSKLLLGH